MSDPHRKRPEPLKATLSIQGIPEALARYRRELANLLRETAMDEEPKVAARLRQLADVFETGLSEEPH